MHVLARKAAAQQRDEVPVECTVFGQDVAEQEFLGLCPCLCLYLLALDIIYLSIHPSQYGILLFGVDSRSSAPSAGQTTCTLKNVIHGILPTKVRAGQLSAQRPGGLGQLLPHQMLLVV
jgi:hypothetical protein